MDDAFSLLSAQPDCPLVTRELAKERLAICSAFSHQHIRAVIVVCNLYMLWAALASGLNAEPVKMFLGVFFSVVPAVALRQIKIGVLPRSVLVTYPLLLNFTHLYLAVDRPVAMLPVHMLAGYVHNVMCIIEYSYSPLQACASILFHILTWAFVLFYYEVPFDDPTEVITMLSVSLVTIIWSLHKFKYQQTILMSYLDFEKKERNIQNLLSKISENIAVLDHACNVKMNNREFTATFAGGEFHELAAECYLDGRSNCSLLSEIQSFIENNTINCNFRTTVSGRVHNCSLYKLEWDEVSCVAFVSQDITQSIALDREKSKAEGVSATLRSITHEIKTPVNFIMQGAAFMCQTEKNVSEKSRQIMERIQLMSEYLLCSVSDMIDYTAAKYNRLSVFSSTTDMHCDLERAQNILQALCSDKQSVILQIAQNCPQTLVLDKARVMQVLLNVASSCLRYENSIRITADFVPHQLTVSVTALGICLDEDMLGDPELGSVEEGVGIRFEIIRELLRAVGSTDMRILHEDDGSTVVFSVAAEEASSESDDYSVPDEREDSKLPTTDPEILIVDDSPLSLEILQETLQSAGLVCETAVNGLQCLEQLRALDARGITIKLVILDIQMPMMDGWECCKQIHALYEIGELQHLPYILGYSAFCSDTEVTKSMECGMHDTLSKPTKQSELFAKLSIILQQKIHQ